MAIPSTSPDVAVVGGGVIGCATAYFLAADHHLRCVVIEREGVGSQASGGAAGELSPVGRSALPVPLVRFGLEGLRLHRLMAPALHAESGTDFHLTDVSVVRPAFNAEEAAELHERMAWQRELGVESTWLDTQAVRSLGTWLAEDALGALHSQEAQLETYPFALALAGAAMRHGVEIRAGEVTGLLGTDGRVTGVSLGQEQVAAQTVVLANGPWSAFAGAWLGFEVPVRPQRGQIVHLAPDVPLPRHAIFHRTGYVLPKSSGDLLIGTTEEDAGFDGSPTPEGQAAILEAVGRIAPAVRGMPIREVTACLRPLSTDGLPLIGAVPGSEGVYLATGHGPKGILLCLATGKYVAQLIVQGRSEYPLDKFAPTRLASAPHHWPS